MSDKDWVIIMSLYILSHVIAGAGWYKQGIENAQEECTEKMNAYREIMIGKMEAQEKASTLFIDSLLEITKEEDD